jgi:hypothetical protein
VVQILRSYCKKGHSQVFELFLTAVFEAYIFLDIRKCYSFVIKNASESYIYIYCACKKLALPPLGKLEAHSAATLAVPHSMIGNKEKRCVRTTVLKCVPENDSRVFVGRGC